VKDVEGIKKWPYAAIGNALEVIPRTLAQNCGANVIRLLTELRTKHSLPDGQVPSYNIQHSFTTHSKNIL
jgi:chaperonin GroEL (HSP60 family)